MIGEGTVSLLYRFEKQTEPNHSIEELAVQCHFNEVTHVVVESLNVQVLVHVVNNNVDPAYDLTTTVGDSTTPIPGLENSKDILNRVQIGGVWREVDVVNVVLAEEVLGDPGVMDTSIVHDKAHFTVSDSLEVVVKGTKELHEVSGLESAPFHHVKDDAIGGNAHE